MLACSSTGSSSEGSGGSSSTGSGGQGGSIGSGGSIASGGSSTGSGGSGKGGATGKGGDTANGGGPSNGGSGAGGANTGGSGNSGGNSAGSGNTAGAAGSSGTCPTDAEEKFSFFILSNAALIRESGKADGFGGGLGGIAGADKICQKVAEYVSPCQSKKVWRAFLSTTTENAIDRVGTGPWYDRKGRLLASTKEMLVMDRPGDADVAIKNDFPNENGTLNRNPDGTGQVDNHETLTGTGIDGKLYNQDPSGTGSMACGPDVGASGQGTWSAERATCWDWTRATEEGCPRVGHSWPRQLSGTNWMSVWNENGCAPGGTLTDTGAPMGRKVGAYGGYGGYYCFAVIPHP
ncbi:MAG TPA: hypothetical protein VFQ61_02835 [Polyangiaceae bacterium]|nr:hypothetical protein [Polyangiaceae bacterium]